jgi:hypothetical protein
MFDTPLRQTCVVRQTRTNTPLHALILLNDVTFVEAARKFAERVMEQAPTRDERIALAFRQATGRRPGDSEKKLLAQGYERTLAAYRADPDAASKLLAAGESPRNAKLDAAELAALTGIASVILNLDEVVTKE